VSKWASEPSTRITREAITPSEKLPSEVTRPRWLSLSRRRDGIVTHSTAQASLPHSVAVTSRGNSSREMPNRCPRLGVSAQPVDATLHVGAVDADHRAGSGRCSNNACAKAASNDASRPRGHVRDRRHRALAVLKRPRPISAPIALAGWINPNYVCSGDVAGSPLDGNRPSLRTARFAEEVAHGRDVTARFADNPYALSGVLWAPFSVAAAPAAL
jgi:hypothetical protein